MRSMTFKGTEGKSKMQDAAANNDVKELFLKDEVEGYGDSGKSKREKLVAEKRLFGRWPRKVVPNLR